MGQKKKAKSVWKKQKLDKIFAKIDYDKFPNYPKRILVYSGRVNIAELNFTGFLIRLQNKRSNIQFEEIDVHNGFDPHGKKIKYHIDKEDFYFPNYDRSIHIFNGYNCIAEIDIRGFLHSVTTNNTSYTLHIQNVDSGYSV